MMEEMLEADSEEAQPSDVPGPPDTPGTQTGEVRDGYYWDGEKWVPNVPLESMQVPPPIMTSSLYRNQPGLMPGPQGRGGLTG